MIEAPYVVVGGWKDSGSAPVVPAGRSVPGWSGDHHRSGTRRAVRIAGFLDLGEGSRVTTPRCSVRGDDPIICGGTRLVTAVATRMTCDRASFEALAAGAGAAAAPRHIAYPDRPGASGTRRRSGGRSRRRFRGCPGRPHAAFVDHADAVLGEVAPVTVLGIDETRRQGKIPLDPQAGQRPLGAHRPLGHRFRRPGRRPGLLGQVEERTGTAVRQWLGEQSEASGPGSPTSSSTRRQPMPPRSPPSASQRRTGRRPLPSGQARQRRTDRYDARSPSTPTAAVAAKQDPEWAAADCSPRKNNCRPKRSHDVEHIDRQRPRRRSCPPTSPRGTAPATGRCPDHADDAEIAPGSTASPGAPTPTSSNCTAWPPQSRPGGPAILAFLHHRA